MAAPLSEFVEVVDQRTHIVQRVPRAWLGDLVLGRFIEKTPAQRALDGELGQAPTEDSTVPEIRAFARDAHIDVTGLTKKDDLLEAVFAVVGTDPLPVGVNPADVQVQLSGVSTSVEQADPDPDSVSGGQPDEQDTPTDPDGTPPPADTPAAGD